MAGDRKVLAAVALVWAWLQLWQFLMVIVVAIIIAVALDPAVRWLEQQTPAAERSAPLSCVLLLAALIVAMIAASWVTLQDQSRLIAQRLTEFVHQVRASFPAARAPACRRAMAALTDSPNTLSGSPVQRRAPLA